LELAAAVSLLGILGTGASVRPAGLRDGDGVASLGCCSGRGRAARPQRRRGAACPRSFPATGRSVSLPPSFDFRSYRDAPSSVTWRVAARVAPVLGRAVGRGAPGPSPTITPCLRLTSEPLELLPRHCAGLPQAIPRAIGRSYCTA